MAYVTLEDLSGSMELTLFPSAFEKYGAKLAVDSIVVVSGRLNIREEQKNTLLVEDVRALEKGAERKLYLRMSLGEQCPWEQVHPVLQRYPGDVAVVLFDGQTRKQKLVPRGMYVNPAPALLTALGQILGKENVKY